MVVRVIYDSRQLWIPNLSLLKSSRKGFHKLPSSRMHFLSGSRKALQEYLNNFG
jgi:hypothetical protein